MTKQQTYQQKREALDAIINDLHDETLDVDIAMQKYEEGLRLIKDLQHYLEQTEHKIETIKAKYT